MRIWFNHWFSTAYYYMQSLKDYYIIASNSNENCVYKLVADEFYVEPDNLSDDDYLNYCKDFVKKHCINIFFVRRGMNIISKHKNEFDCIVICEDYDKLSLFSNKESTANFFRENNICDVPETAIVTNVNDFEREYARLNKKYPYLCVKYNVDEGGQSYKLISEHKPNINRLVENNGLVFSYDYLRSCLSSVKSFPELIIMPYIAGKEISVDCLEINNNLIAIERIKSEKRITVLQKSNKDCVYKFHKLAKLDMPYNIQFRHSNTDNKLYLLEVNTRLAGGAYKSKELGVDFVKLAVDKVLNNIIIPEIYSGTKILTSLEGYKCYD